MAMSDQMRQELLADYQAAGKVAEDEVQTVFLTFSVFFPVVAVAAAGFLGYLFSEKSSPSVLALTGGFFLILSVLLALAWRAFAKRRQDLRGKMFDLQYDISKKLGDHMRKDAIIRGKDPRIEGLAPRPFLGWLRWGWARKLLFDIPSDQYGIWPRNQGEATFVNLMRLSIWIPAIIWLLVTLSAVYFWVCSQSP